MKAVQRRVASRKARLTRKDRQKTPSVAGQVVARSAIHSWPTSRPMSKRKATSPALG